MRRQPEPAGLGTRKARDTQREYSTGRKTPEVFSLSISSLRNAAWSGGSPRQDTRWLKGEGVLRGPMGSPRRGGSTPEPDRSLLSRAISTILDARCDACNRNRGKLRLWRGGPPRHSLASCACFFPSLGFAAPGPAPNRKPFRQLLFSLQLPLSSFDYLRRG
jgi:hypothetical protein